MVGGGQHTSRSGSTIPDRQTEWLVTAPHFYDAEFQPELWFLDSITKGQAFPISDWPQIGMSGQSGQSSQFNSTQLQSNTGSCGREYPRGTQRQVFAFCYAIRDKDDARNFIRGPMSEMIVAEIFPKMKISYCVAPVARKGRKIKLSLESK
jgi:hypothetical protein